MRLLVVGHSYLTAFAQSKYSAMKDESSDLQIRIICPLKMGHLFSDYKQQIAPEFSLEEVPAIKTLFGKTPMTYFLDPLRFAQEIKEFIPDHIHIEEDPYSVIGLESILLARLICKETKISFFVWDNLARNPRYPLNKLKWFLNSVSQRRADLIVCGNHEGARLLRSPKGYKGKIVVLPQLGINEKDHAKPPTLEVSSLFQRDLSVPLVGFIGRLVPEKGIILLLEALSSLVDLPWKLLILGSGPLKSEIQSKWKDLLRGRLILLDAVPHAMVPQYLGCLDMVVLPSYGTPRWKEQFGLILAQAMMAGVPCIGSSSGAIPDVLGPGGVVFKEGDVESLKDALKIFIESRDERERLGKKGKAFALEHYTNQAVARAYLDVFLNMKRNN